MDNKYIFAAYANLATGHMLKGLNGIAIKSRGNKQIKEWSINDIHAFLSQVFDTSTPLNELEKVVEGYFPWIKPILEKIGFANENRQADKLSEAYKNILFSFCTQLDNIRNFHTHFVYDCKIECYDVEFSEGIKHSILWCINQVYDGSTNIIKERFKADETEIEHLRRLKRKGREVVQKTKADNFYYSLQENHSFSEIGIAFFISLFLSRKYSYLFLKQLSGFKRGDTRQYRLTLEVFTALSTKLPVERLRYEENEKLNFSMDILNELSKIPVELYKTLDPQYVQKYDNAFQSVDTDDLFEQPERSRIRFRSRFETFALQYLDEHQDFKEIGFYTYLGNYFHRGYPKTTVDSLKEDRYINFQLAGFCKNIQGGLSSELSSALGVKMLKINEENMINLNSFKPYVAEANPHYIINNNNIGIKILPEGKNCLPMIDGKGAKMPIPDYWLSKYELPAMLFYAYLRKSSKYSRFCSLSIREILKNSVKLEREICKNNQGEDKHELMLRRIEKAIYWCDSKLNEVKRLKEQDIAFGKRQHSSLRAGRIAETLIRDIIWLQPSLSEGKDKVSGPNFQALQRSIAYYGSKRNVLKDIFIRAGLINSKNSHPFLAELDPQNYSSLIAFYIAYLNKRKVYFERQRKKLITGKTNIQCYPLRDLQQTSSIEQSIKMPIFLPRGLFNDVIKECLSKTDMRKSIDFKSLEAGELPVLNVSYLIRNYHSIIQEDVMQDFYNQPRNYHFFDKARDEKKVSKNYLTLEQRIKMFEELKPSEIPISEANKLLEKEERLYRKDYNEICKNESAIRQYEIQDMLLFLIAKEYLPKGLHIAVDKFKLQNIKGILNTPADFSIMQNNITIRAKNVKIKDYGKVFSLHFDTRLSSLSMVLDKLSPGRKIIDYECYKRESEVYERARVNIALLCHQFEKVMISTYSNLEKEKDGYYNFSKLISEYKKGTGSIDDYNLQFIISTRNMFMHDSYNEASISCLLNGLGYAEMIEKEFSSKMNEVILKLENKIDLEYSKGIE